LLPSALLEGLQGLTHLQLSLNLPFSRCVVLRQVWWLRIDLPLTWAAAGH
jgi:hypothetical protein